MVHQEKQAASASVGHGRGSSLWITGAPTSTTLEQLIASQNSPSKTARAKYAIVPVVEILVSATRVRPPACKRDGVAIDVLSHFALR